ncbi:MAG: rubrerythrin family protein [Clostridia bacterium]|nr:rubrerythrin family protein [Clostridia bacterium]
MMHLAGSLTEAGLRAAFAREAENHTRYLLFSEKAKEAGYEQISRLFRETADNEKAHARLLFEALHSSLPAVGEALSLSSESEYADGNEFYPSLARDARNEGFPAVAALYEKLAAVEKEHEARFRALLRNVEGGLVFAKTGEAIWQCGNCGHVHVGKSAPETCPVCSYPQGYFALRAANY